ncbi:MAG: rhodanese-like domain-containing protein [Caldilineaceae bacterium]
MRTNANRLLALLFAALLSFGLAACGGADQTAPASAANGAEPAAASASQIAMADSPQQLSPQTYNEKFAAAGAAHQLIDVRTAAEFESGSISGAVNIPVEELEQRLDEVVGGQPVVVFCRSGNRSNLAARILDDAGFTGVYDLGGVVAWQAAGFPLE